MEEQEITVLQEDHKKPKFQPPLRVWTRVFVQEMEKVKQNREKTKVLWTCYHKNVMDNNQKKANGKNFDNLGQQSYSMGNNSMALTYFRASHYLDNVDGTRHLAYMYANGEGVEQNFDIALELSKNCVERGDEKSMNFIREISKSIEENHIKLKSHLAKSIVARVKLTEEFKSLNAASQQTAPKQQLSL